MRLKCRELIVFFFLWNANVFFVFQNLEFHGVMRFYFQDSGQKVATKCIRVASSSTTKLVISTLVEKFRPDMRMLSAPSYLLYEIHENGGEGEWKTCTVIDYHCAGIFFVRLLLLFLLTLDTIEISCLVY